MMSKIPNLLLPILAILLLLQLHLAYPSVSIDMLGNKNDDTKEATKADIFMAPLRRGEGTLTLDLYFGSPAAQKQTMIVDTGSSIAAIPCEQCHDCGSKQNPTYQNSQSRSFQTIQGCDNCQLGYCEVVHHEGSSLRNSYYAVEECQMEQSYMEASRWEATEVSDIVSLHPPISVQGDNALSHAAFPFIFGCQSSMSGLFLSQPEDGILGMTFSENSYWYQMYSQKIIHEKKFSLCIQNINIDHDEDINSDKAGIITLGGSEKKLHHEPMVFAECFTDGDEWYAVNIENIFLKDNNNDKSAEIKLEFDKKISHTIKPFKRIFRKIFGVNEGKMKKKESSTKVKHKIYLDSGSTETYLPKCLSKPFKKAFRKISGMKKYKDEDLTEEEISVLPSIIFQFTGATIVSQEELSLAQTKKARVSSRVTLAKNNTITIEITPSQYLASRSDGTYDIGIEFSTNDKEGGLFGANFMSDFDILFDMDNSRIGFAGSNCDYKHYRSSSSSKEKILSWLTFALEPLSLIK